MGHGYKIPTIKPSKNPNRSISEIVKERGGVVKREVIVERPPMWGKAYWNYKVKGCFNCKFYRRLQDCKNLDEESFEMFIYTTFKTGICNNYRPEEIETRLQSYSISE